MNNFKWLTLLGFLLFCVGCTPEFDPEAGTFDHDIEVTITNNFQGATVYYTTDGTDPTEKSIPYQGPILLSNTATIKAIAINGFMKSPIASTEYIITDAPPASIEISVSDDTPELGSSVIVTALISDTYGNPLNLPWTLSVVAEPGSDASTVSIDGKKLTFNQEGWFSIVGSVNGTTLSDTAGPFLVDDSVPSIAISNPERGAFRTKFTETVNGTVGDTWSEILSLTVNDYFIEPGDSGNFSHLMEYDVGINLIETLAKDSSDNLKTDRRSVLTGEFLGIGVGINNGIIARINEDTINTIERVGENLIIDADIASMIPDPIFSKEEKTCVWGLCVAWYRLILRISNPSINSVNIELDPQNDTIHATVTAHDVHLDWRANGVITEIPYSASGMVKADSITISMKISPSVSGGVIQTEVQDVNVSSKGFHFDFNSWIYDAAQFFGINADGLVRGFLEDAMEDVVRDEVPDLLEEMLQDLELGTDLDLFGNSYSFLAEPNNISVDTTGLTLYLKTYINTNNWNSSYNGPGSLYAEYSSPLFNSASGMIVSISSDFLNQALFEFWGGGLLIQEFKLAELDLDTGDLSFLPIDLTNPHIAINAMLPPVVMPGTSNNLLDIQLGDLEVGIYNGDPALKKNLLVRMYAGGEAGLNISVTANGTLSASTQNLTTWFDIDYVDASLPNQMETFLEDLLKQIMPNLMPLITDAIGEIPIPEFAGYTLSNIKIEAAGSENGYVNASGTVTGP